MESREPEVSMCWSIVESGGSFVVSQGDREGHRATAVYQDRTVVYFVRVRLGREARARTSERHCAGCGLNNLIHAQQQSGSGNNLVPTSNPSLNNLLLGQQPQNGSNSNLNLALLMEITRNSAAGGGGGTSGTAGTQNATW